MSEQNKPFVVTDRRKFTLDGEPRPDADPSPSPRAPPGNHSLLHRARAPTAAAQPASPRGQPKPSPAPPPNRWSRPARLPATSERLDTAVRAANPGMDHPPAMSFEQIVQSIYMTTIMQLGGATQPGQQPKVDLMGARQSIDMLAILAEKTKGNLTPAEAQLMDNALFEVRMGFLEVTQALARSAASRQPPGRARHPAARSPSIVR